MSEMSLEREIIELVRKLDSEKQRRALEYTRSLNTTVKGISGKEFIARTRDIYIPPDELEAMKQAIEEDCENIDPDE